MDILWLEASLEDLYKGAEKAFPETRKRQFSTDTIVVENLYWVPFQGVKTLFVKATVKNEGRKHESIILFKGVKYKEREGRGAVPLRTSTGKEVFVEQISAREDDVLVRCSCKDFYWRFLHFNKNEGCLYGRDRAKYEALKNPGSSNPNETAGLCKHLIKMVKILKESNLLK